jgi:hypothetical protein
MPDHAALYGLIGTLIGVLIGSGATVFGPLLLHRFQARERAEQTRLDGQWRERQYQREIELARQADHSDLVRQLINLRAATRDYLELLLKLRWTLTRAHGCNAGDLSSELDNGRRTLNSAFDEALTVGIWWAHARAAKSLIATTKASLLDAVGREPGGFNATNLGEAVSEAHLALQRCVDLIPDVPDSYLSEAADAIRRLETERDEFVAHIKMRLVRQPDLDLQEDRPC